MTLTSTSAAHGSDRKEAILLGLAFLFLAGTSFALGMADSVQFGSWQAGQGSWQHLILLPVWIMGAILSHHQAKIHLPSRDPLLLPVGMLLAGWGGLTVWRLLPDFGMRQTGWIVVGIVVMVLIFRQETKLAWLKRYRYLWLAAGLLLTALTLLFGTHPSGGEPRLWLGLGGFYIQPSEFLRLLLIAYFASFLADRVSTAWDQEPPAMAGVLTPLVVVWGISIGLLFVQRDLGTGTLFMGLLTLLLYLTTGRSEVILVGAAMILLGGLAASLTFGVVQGRMAAWLNPWADPIGVGYQIIQASMSMAAGGLLGQGMGLGAPGFVPAAHTDFIFSSVVEEWGLLGGLAMLAMLAFIVHRGLRIAKFRNSTFSLILAAGLSAGMGLQVLLILGGVLRLLPLTGITVPFVSYGGSSLVTSYAALGLLLKISSRPAGQNRYRPFLEKLELGWLLGVGVLALAMGWWTVVQAPDLQQQSGNPRRALAARFSRRGAVLDRSGEILAESVAEVGDISRYYPEPAAGPVVGFSSNRYGQAGLEAQLDPILRGEDGYDLWTVWKHRLLTGTPPPGHDLRLTLSLPMQRALMEALEGHVGAAVLIEANSGEILAVASSPFYNSNQIDETWGQLTNDPQSPLLNRATQSSYQPGVAIAPLLYAWSVEQDQPPPDELAGFAAAVPLDGAVLRCAWPTEEQEVGSTSLALRLGCPAPWGSLAEELGSDSINAFVAAFGLDSRASIPLPESEPWSGQAPANPEGLREFGYGQGGLTLNPLQVARAYATIVRGGELPSLTLLDAIRPPGGDWTASPADETGQSAVGAASARAVSSALALGPQLEFTAEAVAGGSGQRLAWFIAAAADHPGQPLLVLVLEGESGSSARNLGLPLLSVARNHLP
ncbi:MAG: FtsW/RodA/SpoVE family cell cycle protein [Anaerolineales bacterium]